ncbi:hypothetical protein [Aliiroseovarius lamellibrachiae]|uniref:hypothetical protein n=1 Tax=Aliiroseovarius lamellibrachiae TaxID=1924933 RepID=UPI001BDFF945|nr:hypothetical protein [Aliiroseovarius lamellibrachiae]MBT2131312.1 hypothetical protein [Aliiroseovarius lamellibrachiae]
MKKLLVAGAVLTALGACNGQYNPLTNPKPAETELPPGTEDPGSGSSVERYEAEDGNGNGYAQSITYDEASNTFTVDNLAFDGANEYTQDDDVATLRSYRVYENASTFKDSVTGTPINQFSHKAILGISKNTNADGTPVSQFAVVRTGAYRGYGFGGFMYERNGGVVLPTSGQATFSGDYAGLRDFNGQAGLEYTTGDMVLDIDFNDFNAGDAVKGRITKRQVYSLDGINLTSTYVTEINADNASSDGWVDLPTTPNQPTGPSEPTNPANAVYLPTLTLTVSSDTLNSAGELTNGISSSHSGVVLENGNYYAVLAGEGADMEVAGIVVIDGKDPGNDSVTIRETGGFILYR